VNVVVTGAGGNLGRVAIPALQTYGHDVRAVDFRSEVDGALHADLRDPADVRRAVAGADAVVHAAALHGVHLDRYEPADYWATNVTATFNVYEAAREAGVRRVVLCSSMAVYGAGAERTNESWAVVTEDVEPQPTDVYGLSKLLCEQLGRHYARVHSITTVALRFGMFVPETFERYGFRLLFGGVDDRDVAQAVALALGHEPAGGFAAYNVMAETPFADADARLLAADPAAAIERHWPGSGELFAERGVDVGSHVWGWALWRVEAAQRELGYRTQFGFGEFLDALRRGDASHYPYAGLPQWGLD
jgi:UDP-glucose 4-epimerase